MTSVAGEMMKTQARRVKTKKQIMKVKRKTAKEEMKRDNIQSLNHGPVHPLTDVQETTIQNLGKRVFLIYPHQISVGHSHMINTPASYSESSGFVSQPRGMPTDISQCSPSVSVGTAS
jgi:hypothetical protein